MPQYRFDQADVIVSIDADFLGTWISPVQYTRGYASRRRISETAPTKSYHVQIESRLSLTGSNADRRLRVAPGEIGHVTTHLAAKLAQRAGTTFAAEGLAASPLGRGHRRRRRAAVDRSRPRAGDLRKPGRARPGALQFHQPDDRRLRHDGRSGAPVLPARGERRGARRAARRAVARRSRSAFHRWAPTRCTTCRTAPRWRTIFGACLWS